ncbi:NAD-dependent epimerase/dehydratase family protein [Serratia sp. Je.1.23.a]|uniref:NAD-dependent epimerase/dehydratase family protein n=1 Tax=Serratia sp. Je.1.23.a TaxID=3142841 RepID=UPI003DA8F198
MKILIIGAGSIGVHAALNFIHQGHTVTIVDKVLLDGSLADQVEIKNSFLVMNINDYNNVSRVFQDFSPEIVIHTAGVMDSKVNSNAVAALQVNIVDSLNIFDECEKNSVKKILFTSSLAVYDFNNQNFDFDEYSPKTSTNMYGLGKLICENYLNKIALRSNTKTLSLRFCGVYGAGDFVGGAWMGRYLKSIVQNILNASSGTKVIVEKDVIGNNEYLYISDAAKSLYHFAFNDATGALNISPGEITSFQELVSTLQQVRHDICIDIVGSKKCSVILNRSKPLSTTLSRKWGFDCDYSSFEKGFRDYLSYHMINNEE